MTTSINIPIGTKIIQRIWLKCCPTRRINRNFWYRFSVLFLTYLAYMCYHMTRKPMSVVKNVLHRNCSNLEHTFPQGYKNEVIALHGISRNETWCDWAPFDGNDSSALLGTLDSAFLFAYAFAMFASGLIAEHVSLRYFLSIGMLLSALACYLFGIAKTYNIHNIWYFIIIQAFAGLVQTTGWPGVVTVIGRWFGKSKRGLIFGIWNSHTSIGNILGSLIAAHYVEKDWSMSFIIPGLIMGVVGFVLFLFLVDSPGHVNCQAGPGDKQKGVYRRLETDSDSICSETDETEVLINEQESSPSLRVLRGSVNSQAAQVHERSPILRSHHPHNVANGNTVAPAHEVVGFFGALRIPGVLEYSLCLFFSKLVSYTFLYWLPLYIQSSTTLGATLSADLSTLFDVGGIVGAIAAGVLSDSTGMSACTCVAMFAAAAPMLLLYQQWGAVSVVLNVVLLFIVGALVNGPYALITTAVSAELGTHSSLDGNNRALATVTAIIDGTGSIGAAVGPLIAGLVSSGSWAHVFYMLIASDLIAMLLLCRLVIREVKRKVGSGNARTV